MSPLAASAFPRTREVVVVLSDVGLHFVECHMDDQVWPCSFLFFQVCSFLLPNREVRQATGEDMEDWSCRCVEAVALTDIIAVDTGLYPDFATQGSQLLFLCTENICEGGGEAARFSIATRIGIEILCRQSQTTSAIPSVACILCLVWPHCLLFPCLSASGLRRNQVVPFLLWGTGAGKKPFTIHFRDTCLEPEEGEPRQQDSIHIQLVPHMHESAGRDSERDIILDFVGMVCDACVTAGVQVQAMSTQQKSEVELSLDEEEDWMRIDVEL